MKRIVLAGIVISLAGAAWAAEEPSDELTKKKNSYLGRGDVDSPEVETKLKSVSIKKMTQRLRKYLLLKWGIGNFFTRENTKASQWGLPLEEFKNRKDLMEWGAKYVGWQDDWEPDNLENMPYKTDIEGAITKVSEAKNDVQQRALALEHYLRFSQMMSVLSKKYRSLSAKSQKATGQKWQKLSEEKQKIAMQVQLMEKEYKNVIATFIEKNSWEDDFVKKLNLEKPNLDNLNNLNLKKPDEKKLNLDNPNWSNFNLDNPNWSNFNLKNLDQKGFNLEEFDEIITFELPQNE